MNSDGIPGKAQKFLSLVIKVMAYDNGQSQKRSQSSNVLILISDCDAGDFSKS